MPLKVNINKIKYKRPVLHPNRLRRFERPTTPILPPKNKHCRPVKPATRRPNPKITAFPLTAGPAMTANPFPDIFFPKPAPKTERSPNRFYRSYFLRPIKETVCAKACF